MSNIKLPRAAFDKTSNKIFIICSILFLCGCGGGSSPKNSAPEAVFTVSADSGIAPLTVTFNASGSSDSDGTISSYTWRFGDSGTGSGSTVQHTYLSAGTYTARLTVTDDDDLTGTASLQIVVSADPASLTYTIQGTVTSAEHVVADSDVNDFNASYTSNDSFSEAQIISAPVTVSGFVNVDNTGSYPDRFEDTGDYNDYYQAALTNGMTISLYMAKHSSNSELNLYLYDSNRTLVTGGSTSIDSNGIASLTVPENGTYYIRVEAAEYIHVRTFTLYALTIGLTTTAATHDALCTGDDFVPGEVLVRFKDGTEGVTSLSAAEPGAVSGLGFKTKAGKTGRARLLTRPDSMDKDSFYEKLGIRAALKRSLAPGNMDMKNREKLETLWMVRALRKQSNVRYAEPNYIRKQLLVPNDGYYSYQWHYPLITLPDAWDITTGSSNVVVAVVDTGVLIDHPDLQGQLVDGYDFISDTETSLDGDGIDANPDDPGDQDDVDGSSSFHGTHVAGIIAASSDNRTGAASIAWNTKIMPLRVLGKGGGTTYDIMEAVKYAAGLENDSGIVLSDPVEIINLSLGGEGATSYEREIYSEVRDRGIIVVASAGNDGSDVAIYPAAYENVVSVSAVTIDETLASYSNYGSTVDVAAPGGSSTDTNWDGYMDGVLSTSGDDSSGSIEMTYAFATGTSLAAPHVSGVVALMKSLYPGLAPDEFDSLLAGGYLTQDIGDEGRDESFGYGLIDAYKSVLMAQEIGGGSNIPAILTVNPGILNFAASMSTADILVENGGGNTGSLLIIGVSSSAAWLSVNAAGDVDAQGLGNYTITVDRDSLDEGAYSGTITFESNENDVTVSVVMRVGDPLATTDGGHHYFLLLDPETFDPVKQDDSPGVNGVYGFSFSGLFYDKTYVVYAGTDLNNDGYICDDGEACGAYLSLDSPMEMTVLEDVTGINFTTDINISLPNTSSSLFARDGAPVRLKVLKEVER